MAALAGRARRRPVAAPGPSGGRRRPATRRPAVRRGAGPARLVGRPRDGRGRAASGCSSSASSACSPCSAARRIWRRRRDRRARPTRPLDACSAPARCSPPSWPPAGPRRRAGPGRPALVRAWRRWSRRTALGSDVPSALRRLAVDARRGRPAGGRRGLAGRPPLRPRPGRRPVPGRVPGSARSDRPAGWSRPSWPRPGPPPGWSPPCRWSRSAWARAPAATRGGSCSTPRSGGAASRPGSRSGWPGSGGSRRSPTRRTARDRARGRGGRRAGRAPGVPPRTGWADAPSRAAAGDDTARPGPRPSLASRALLCLAGSGAGLFLGGPSAWWPARWRPALPGWRSDRSEPGAVRREREPGRGRDLPHFVDLFACALRSGAALRRPRWRRWWPPARARRPIGSTACWPGCGSGVARRAGVGGLSRRRRPGPPRAHARPGGGQRQPRWPTRSSGWPTSSSAGPRRGRGPRPRGRREGGGAAGPVPAAGLPPDRHRADRGRPAADADGRDP